MAAQMSMDPAMLVQSIQLLFCMEYELVTSDKVNSRQFYRPNINQ